jgi:hypothetical protein
MPAYLYMVTRNLALNRKDLNHSLHSMDWPRWTETILEENWAAVRGATNAKPMTIEHCWVESQRLDEQQLRASFANWFTANSVNQRHALEPVHWHELVEVELPSTVAGSVCPPLVRQGEPWQIRELWCNHQKYLKQ